MNKKIITTLIISLFIANTSFAEYTYVDPSDYTGDAFFTNTSSESNTEKHNNGVSRSATTPPLKKARLMIQNKIETQKENKSQFAPTAPVEGIYTNNNTTSEYASKDIQSEFDENMMPDGFEADEQSIEESSKSKHFWNKNKV